jgi:uncharacterized membrane protein
MKCLTLAAGAAALLVSDAIAGTITSLGIDPVLGTFRTQFSNNQVSNDGAVVGFYQGGTSRAVYRSASGTTSLLGALPSANGVDNSIARVISADGSIIAGYAVGKAATWSAATGSISALPNDPANSGNADAKGISDDGSTIVGWVYESALNTTVATRWTGAGRQLLGSLEAGRPSFAFGATADGATVVGYGGTSAGNRAFRWNATDGLTQLGMLAGATASTCGGISGDGSTAFGTCTIAGKMRAVIWNSAGVATDLGLLQGGTMSYAQSCTADGSMVFGGGDSSSGSKGFVWTAATGLMTLETYLTNNGVDLTGWTELGGPACSPNGQYLVGWGKYNGVSQCFVAAVPAPGAIALLGIAGVARGRRRRG